MQPTPEAMLAITAKLEEIASPPLAVRTFLHHYTTLCEGSTGLISDASIHPLEHVASLSDAHRCASSGEQVLPHAAVIKLNGGLGTSMGLEEAKSLIPVRPGLTFLDIIAGQIKALRRRTGAAVPLLLMNSEHTQSETEMAIARHDELAKGQTPVPVTFLQHRVPKIREDTLAPLRWPSAPHLEWCPPGHGDIYTALHTSGLLDRLLAADMRYAFISNSDNLGATLDLDILGYIAEGAVPFLMEVTRRTEADKKGGHLARSQDQRLLLRERAQCPPDEEDSFQDIHRYRFFNTNNLWVDLRALKRAMAERDNILDLPLIVNKKTADPRDRDTPAVLQLETAMGAAISCFPDARVLEVPRQRFAPVKTTEDLLALWSDAYRVTDEMRVELDASRQGRPPAITLAGKWYKRLDDFTARFPGGAPSLLKCDALLIEGDIRFGEGVRLEGDVHLRNAGPEQVVVADGAVYASGLTEWP